MQINTQNYKPIAELIRGFLEETELVTYDELPTCKEIEKKLKKAIFGENGISSQQLGCDVKNECAIFALYDRSKTIDELLSSVMQYPLPEGEAMLVHVVFLTLTIAELKKLEGARDDIVKKAKWWTQNRKTEKKKSIVRFYGMHSPERNNKTFSISLNSRICALHHTSLNDKGVSIGSSVYIANLYDIVEMFSQIGAELFERNVRYHIKDILNVESEIQKTLESNPSEFFNFNNGIAIQIGDINKLDRRSEKLIRVTYENRGDISVINGAQTISAAAEFFFQSSTGDADFEKTQKAIQRAKDEANVLLRVFYPEQDAKKNHVATFEQISISLNRQKPINPMDMQYTCNEVTRLNDLFEKNMNSPYFFRLLKRGQKVPGRFQYQLSEFGRLVTAYYLNEPGRARAESTQEIIKYTAPDEDNDDSQAKSTIYAPFTMGQEDLAIFMKWYKPVNFANEISVMYTTVDKQSRKQEDMDEKTRVVLRNGRYFFVAFIIRLLNQTNPEDTGNPDFSGFMFDAEMIKPVSESLEKHIIGFAELVAAFGTGYLEGNKKGRAILNSNDFKTEELYKEWCQFSVQDESVKQWAEDLRVILGENTSNSTKD